MKLAAPAFAAGLAAACCSPQLRAPALPPPDPYGRVVAMLDGEPVRLRDVLTTAAETDLDALLRRHLVGRLIERRKRELGIVNSFEERLARARRVVVEAKSAAGAGAFDESLTKMGRSEEEYARTYAETDALDARLTNEKIASHALRAAGHVKTDLEAFEDADARRLSFRIEGLRLAAGWMEADLGAQGEREIFETEPGGSVGPLRAGSGHWVVVKVLDRLPPGASIDPPPSDEEIRLHVDWLLRRSRIEVVK